LNDLPEPLFAEPLPEVAPDEAGERLLEVMREALSAVRDPHCDRDETERQVDIARHAVYASATSAMEDGWRLRRVVQVEEWTAELARRDQDWHRAYVAWRTAFWIRHQAGDDVARSRRVLEVLGDLRAGS